MSPPDAPFILRVEPSRAGDRLDSFVASEIENCSRSFASSLVRQGKILVDGCKKKPGYTLKHGDVISGTLVQPEIPDFQPEAIPLDILYEDSELIVVNKSPGMVVHPAPGHFSGTLVNALMHHCPDLKGISGSLRPGIVHRLDKDTSGAIVAAKNSRAMNHLAAQFKNRNIGKRYVALVYGVPNETSGTIDLPIGRHPSDRKKMSVISRKPRQALTHWSIRDVFTGACLLELDIRTGRTHQIRVHCLSMGHPVIGDPVYSNRGLQKQLAQVSRPMAQVVKRACRQMLHARSLRFAHPVSDRWITIKAPLPEDMWDLMSGIREISG